MNSLKPLLIVAVLAGVGYGVYVRLNRGSNAPPPPVAEGWDTTPSVQLPDQGSMTPWVPGTEGPPPAGPFGAAPVPGGPADAGVAPPYQPPGAAPPYQPPGAAPSATAPPGPAAPPADHMAGNLAPPYPSAPGSDAGAPPPSAPQPGTAPPFAPGSSPVPPSAGAPPSPPAVDPYADSQAPAADRYPAPPTDYTADAYQTAPAAGAPVAAPTAAGAYPAPNAATPDGAYPPAEAPQGSAPQAESYPPAADAALSGAAPGGDFANAFEAAQRQLEAGQMAEALRHLSQWYDNPQLTPDQQQTLTQVLDQVAGTVVYSTQNLLEPPYEVQPGERLEDIGEKYNVPWKLLAKINGVDDPASLKPGERLKVVRGPFQAIISLEKRELTLLTADGSYAGRFQVGLGAEHPPQEGTFPVAEKVVNPVYYGRDRAIGAEDAANPLGERWIGLGSNVGIHGTNDPQNIGRTDLPGSISLSERDAEDVFDILSLGSRVTIRR